MSDIPALDAAASLGEVIHDRHSERAPYDPSRQVLEADLEAILEAARWAPTAHNMQNHEIIVVDDRSTLAAIGRLRAGVSRDFVKENYAQLSFSEEELMRKGTGVLATMFPPSWRTRDAEPDAGAERATLDATMRSCPVTLIVLYDPLRRAPASEGDFLGIMSLGCVMQNMWLMAQARGIGMQIMSVFGGGAVEDELRSLLSIPSHLRIAFACRLGYRAGEARPQLRVRRPIGRFVHRNTYRDHGGVEVPAGG
ncbi:MAG: nitroreductase family protein [Candidatus Dormibacteria bacterium]|jgi:nitroreductase